MALVCLFAAISLWLLGNSLTFFCELLFSPRGAGEISAWPYFKVFDLISGVGMLMTPPLLVHAFAAQMRAGRSPRFNVEAAPARRLRTSLLALLGDCALAVFYLPLFFFLPSIIFLFHPNKAWLLTQRTGMFAGTARILEIAGSETTFIAKDLRYLIPYLCYLLVAGLACTVFTRVTITHRRRRDDKLYFRTFYRAFWLMNAAMIIIVSACAVLAFAMPGTYVDPSTGRALKVFSLVASLGPGVILTSYAYRYNYMSLHLWRRPLHVGAALLAAVVCLQGFNAAAGWIEEVIRVNLVIVQVVTVAVIVALLGPARSLMRRLVYRVVVRMEDLHRRRLLEISEQLNAPSIFTLSQMFDFVADGIRQAFDVSRVVLLAYQRPSLDRPAPVIHASNILRATKLDTGTILSFLSGGRRKYVDLLTSRNPQLIEEIRALRCQLIFPLARGGRIIGLLAVGKSAAGSFGAGEIEMLGMFAGHVATAVENLMLVDDKVNLRQKMLESEKLLSLGRLSASVAHEVKNPLSAIKTITQVVQEDLPPDSPIQGDLSMICSEIDRLNNVVNRLLEFARPSRTTETAVDLYDVVDSVVAVLRHEASRNKVQIIPDIDPELPPMLLNVEALKEILFNLILNGIQAVEGGGCVSVAASIAAENREEAHLRIVVADTGPGIAQENLERIFEPFFTTRAVGTGLGLPIVRQKVTDLGGTISVINDGGARFTIRIPFVSAVPSKRETAERVTHHTVVRK